MKTVWCAMAAALTMALAGCSTYEGGTATDTDTVTGTGAGIATPETGSDFGRGEAWRVPSSRPDLESDGGTMRDVVP